MGAFYGRKIKEGILNPKTGKSWKINDVPSLWRNKTEDWIKENKEETT